MVQYHELSQFYDSLTRDQPYTSWRDIIEHYREHRQTLLDIGCGTGNLTTLLRDFDTVFGMDLSIDMLTLAEQKSSNVQWVEADMTDFDLGLQFDIVTILCDSLNYLASEQEVKQTFESIYQHLTPGGLLIFDVHTEHKMQTWFNNQCYIDETDQVFLAWEAVRGEEPLSVWHDLTFFVQNEDHTYHRINESHYQRTYTQDTYLKMLQEQGFIVINTFTDFEYDACDAKGNRLFFIAKK